MWGILGEANFFVKQNFLTIYAVFSGGNAQAPCIHVIQSVGSISSIIWTLIQTE